MADKKITYAKLSGLILFLLCFLAFSLTLSSRFYGYEKATLRSMQNILYRGDFSSHTAAGLMDMACYLPMEWINCVFVDSGDFLLRDFISLFTLPLMSALICLVFYLALLELFDSVETALQTALLFAFSAMIFPYSKMGMEIQHTLFSVASLWTLVCWKKREKRIFLVLFGVCTGLILHTKVYGFVMTGAICLYVLFDGVSRSKTWKESVRSLAPFFLPVFCSVILLSLVNVLRFGSPFLGSRYNMEYEAKRIPLWQGLYGFLFSSGKSIFIYNPLLVASVFLFPRFLRRFGWLKLLLMLVFGIGLVFHSLFWIWTDETWGPRKLHYLVPFAFLPVGILVEGFRSLSLPKRALVILLVILGIFVQILGVSISYEAQPVMLQWHDMASLENLRYNPRLSHTTINYALLGSTIDRYAKRETHYLIYKPTYFATVKPSHPVKPVGISMKLFSCFDFWFLDNRPPRQGNFALRPFIRIYFSLILILIPIMFLLLYILNSRIHGDKRFWKKRPAIWILLIFFLFGAWACLAYNRAYSRVFNEFIAGIQDTNRVSIGNDPVDETILGHGWRDSEWMRDPKNSKFEIPFRWTNADKSSLFIPVLPHTSYDLSIKIVFVYPTRLSFFANGHRVGYIRGKKDDNVTASFHIPASAIGQSPVCEVEIQHHNMHIPALEDPEHSKDSSTLGVIIFDLQWNKGKYYE
ncbi:glycosyltransferase family 39 protein [Candidatus Sumerlaeota bacterium]|nr:glycosyltransferase family 39 protein [Candidatus Sumerlaeota bacterium]